MKYCNLNHNYLNYDGISETKQKTNIEIKELKQELEVYKKALAISCEWNELNLGYLNEDECLQKARE